MGSELSGKVAIITGGTNGLGRATAELFLEEGAKVVIGDVDESGAALATELGESCRFLRADVAEEADMQALVDLAVSEFGRVDVMCNNAGIGSRLVRLLDDPLDDFNRNLNVNLLGVMRGTQIAGRQMIKNGGGSIINTASIAATFASGGNAIYRSAKAAVVQFSRTAAMDLAEYDIRVNCILPGQIVTGMMTKRLAAQGISGEKLDKIDNATREIMSSYQAIRRRGVPRDVANAMLFLASDRSSYITGIVLPVDGGITAGNPTDFIAKFAQVRAAILAGDDA